MSLWSRIANVFRSHSVDRDIDEELESHFEAAQVAGRDPAEASRAFGSRLRTHEAVRDIIVAAWLESLLADARFGWRQLLKHKRTSAAAVVSLALGIGSCTAAFRLIDALFLRPLPVADPGRLYVVGYGIVDDSGKADTGDTFDYPAFRVLRAAVKEQAELMAISPANFGGIDITYGSDQEMERVDRQYVSGWTFAEFGLRPALGRLFTEADDLKPGAHPYAVLSYEYWLRRFGKDPNVLGRTFRTGGDSNTWGATVPGGDYQIIGVAPPGFTGTDSGTLTDMFVPTMMNARAISQQNMQWFRTWVHLRPGTSAELVRQKLRAAFLAYRHEQAKSWRLVPPRDGAISTSLPRCSWNPQPPGFPLCKRLYRRALLILGALVALLLLIACANVANLMTAQAAARAREMALRVAIGAGRRRLIQLVLMEGALLAIISSALGILFAGGRHLSSWA